MNDSPQHLSSSDDETRHLTSRQLLTLAVRAQMPADTYARVALVANVGLSSLFRWLNHPVFKACWDDRQLRQRELEVGMRADGELVSLRTLIDVQGKAYDDVPASVQVDAASKLLTSNQRKREHETVSAGQWMSWAVRQEMAAESEQMLSMEHESEAIEGETKELEADDTDAD